MSATLAFEDASALTNPLGLAAIFCAVASAAILVWYLVSAPRLSAAIKVLLLFGIAVFPIGTALLGNFTGFATTQERRFCASCHVMRPYTDDSADTESRTLASIHARNGWFGDRNCYTCHTDYGLFGTVVTKISGLKHVARYYSVYREIPAAEALPRIHLYRPFRNEACLRCHSMAIPAWLEVRDHRSAIRDLEQERVSCAGEGCHGPVHPFSKPTIERIPQPEAWP